MPGATERPGESIRLVPQSILVKKKAVVKKKWNAITTFKRGGNRESVALQAYTLHLWFSNLAEY